MDEEIIKLVKQTMEDAKEHHLEVEVVCSMLEEMFMLDSDGFTFGGAVESVCAYAKREWDI